MIQSIMPEQKTRYEWHYMDLEAYIKDNWGQEWEGGAAMGFPSQDTYLDYDVNGGELGIGIDENGTEREAHWMTDEADLDQARAIIEKFKAEGMPREEYAEPGLELLLNWLCHEGVIPAGNYRILVWW